MTQGKEAPPSLQELFEASHLKLHKWTNYFHVYEQFLAPYRDKPVTMLEIGVQQGGSARLFRDYLGPQTTIIGIDIDPGCKAHETDGITIEIGDQADPAFLAHIASTYGPFDIVLDDGGHTLNQILTSYELLIGHVRTPGVYMIEDTCCQYWAGDSFRDRPGESIDDFYLGINKIINEDMAREDLFDHWHIAPEDRTENLAATGPNRLIHSLHLYESMAVIERRPRPIAHCVLRT